MQQDGRKTALQLRHLSYYARQNSFILRRGVPLRELLMLKKPLLFKDAKVPPMVSVDITDACDLSCVYCNNPLFPHPRAFMQDQIVQNLLQRLEQTPVNRVRIGGGEPTLHTALPDILSSLSKRTKLLTMVSNGQWKNPALTEEILSSGLNLLEISVDAGGREIYEKSRPGASYGRLLANLSQLKTARKLLNSKTLIRIRLMLRPSTLHLESVETRFLANYSDFIFPQKIVKHPDSGYAEDVFVQSHVLKNTAPFCSVPFKDLQVRPDGSVPICPAKGCAVREHDRVFLGNVEKDSLSELWNHPRLQEIRLAHRTRRGEILSLCRNCHYG